MRNVSNFLLLAFVTPVLLQLSLFRWLFIHFTIQSLLEYHKGFTFFTSIGLLSFSTPQFAIFVWITSTPQLHHLNGDDETP